MMMVDEVTQTCARMTGLAFILELDANKGICAILSGIQNDCKSSILNVFVHQVTFYSSGLKLVKNWWFKN